MKRNVFFELLFGAALFIAGIFLTASVTRPLSLYHAQTLAGGTCCYTDRGDCDYNTNGPCEDSVITCAHYDATNCSGHRETEHEAGHEWFCDDSNSDHCLSTQSLPQYQPCAIEYYCYVPELFCERSYWGWDVNNRRGCAGHPADKCPG
jgi:hypothetical protein